jgi:hypothetical protein
VGGYINFAICDFYNDNSFADLSTLVVKSILNQDITDVLKYQKVSITLYKFIEEYFKKHLELMFLKMDLDLLKQIFERILVPGILCDNEEIKGKSLQTVDLLNVFIFNNFKKPPKKQP